MIPLTDDGHCSRGLGSEKLDGRVGVSLDQPQWVTVYDPLRGVPVVGLKVIKSKEKLRQCGDSVVIKLQILGLTFSPIRLGLWSTSWCECSYLLPSLLS